MDETNAGASAAPSLAVSTEAKKKARVPKVEETSLEEISDRCAAGCSCRSGIFFEHSDRGSEVVSQFDGSHGQAVPF